MILQALEEDAATRDVTSRAVIPKSLHIRARLLANGRGVLAGVKVVALTFTTLDPSVRCRLRLRSGAAVSSGATILTVEGPARSIFAAERVALNFLGHLSGIATLTRAFVDRVDGTRARIYDTRKTLPGLRALEKYAVRAGGGYSHRTNLANAVLIKTSHLRACCQTIQEAIRQARRNARGKFVEIEVTNRREFRAALAAHPDAILLDNWPTAAIARAVKLRGHTIRRPILEASGGVTLANVRAIARTGVDHISIGRLTHSAPYLDVSLKVT